LQVLLRLSGYESQVSALLDEEERMAMEFYIACAPEDHPKTRRNHARLPRGYRQKPRGGVGRTGVVNLNNCRGS
jgi:hypothetical protein